MKKMIILTIILICLFMGAFAETPVVSQFNYDPSPAVPGDIITVLIQVENTDSSTKDNVTVTIENQYPFTVQEETTKDLGSIEKYGKTLTTFKVYIDPSAKNTTYSLPITIVTKQETVGKTVNRDIIVSGKEPIVKVISISESRLIPGQEKEIVFGLQNMGTSTAYDVIVELQEDRTVTATGTIVEREITPLGTALAYVDKLDPKEMINSTIKISVNREADLKNYTLPVKVSYRNSSGTRTEETSYIGFKIAGEVEMDLALKETVDLIAGQEQTLTFELFNKGAGKAEFTIANIQTNIGEIDKPKQFIGSLQPNDVDSFKTLIKINSNAQTATGIINITLEYQDTDATMKTTTVEIPVQVYSAQDGAARQEINPVGGIINLVILIIIVFGGWKVYKKFKNKK
ncbi:MAG: hypothetical protein WC915_01625 [archaeon]|jgi:hypothetical protein